MLPFYGFGANLVGQKTYTAISEIHVSHVLWWLKILKKKSIQKTTVAAAAAKTLSILP